MCIEVILVYLNNRKFLYKKRIFVLEIFMFYSINMEVLMLVFYCVLLKIF